MARPYTVLVNSGPRELRPSLENQRFHAIVIGGGINGVAIARECVRAGRRTLLVEQNDFGSGTTSRSTRIIHGGLRYLEHGEFGLVRESLAERKTLLRRYSHLVHPLQFVLALDSNSRRSALKIRAGLWLYRVMAGGRRPAEGKDENLQKLARSLDAGRRWSLFSFQDAQCEFPERLIAEWLVEAMDAGAVARNHTQVLAVDVRQGHAKAVLIRDRLSGKEERVEAGWIVNATGPWADRICQRSKIRTQQPLLGGVRGSHIVLPRFPGAPDSAVYSEAGDGRPIFVIPWNDQILVGTTESEDNTDPGKAQPSGEEIDYLLRSFASLFPRPTFTVRDIRYTFAGIRPLPYAPNAKLSAVTRRHYLHDHRKDDAAQMISVIGGKLTTAVHLARECAAKIGASAPKRSRTNDLPESADGANGTLDPRRISLGMIDADVDPLLDAFVTDIANAGGISESSASGIVEWHGKRSGAIARMALSSAQLRAPLCPHTGHIVAEAVDAFANECAMTLADVLLRRVPVALGACWSRECTREAASVLKPVMEWSDQQTAREMEEFETEREAFLKKPS
ncbi:MAG: FAD-dependent oxidoreductase [Terriglobales bacterium]